MQNKIELSSNPIQGFLWRSYWFIVYRNNSSMNMIEWIIFLSRLWEFSNKPFLWVIPSLQNITILFTKRPCGQKFYFKILRGVNKFLIMTLTAFVAKLTEEVLVREEWNFAYILLSKYDCSIFPAILDW